MKFLIIISGKNMMLKEVLLFLMVLASANSGPRRLNERIIGGHEVDIRKHPYQAALNYYGSVMCGAVNIAPFFMLTAAKCIDGANRSYLMIHVGSSHYASGGLWIKIEEFHVHPLYDRRTMDYDITVLKLSVGLGSGAGVSSIALPRQDQVFPAGTEATVTGWGNEAEWGPYFDKLRAADISIIDTEKCRETYVDHNITARMLCAGVPQGDYGACQGDQGSPLVIEGPLLVGLSSWGVDCGWSNYPSVFTNVAALRDFIKEIANV